MDVYPGSREIAVVRPRQGSPNREGDQEDILLLPAQEVFPTWASESDQGVFPEAHLWRIKWDAQMGCLLPSLGSLNSVGYLPPRSFWCQLNLFFPLFYKDFRKLPGPESRKCSGLSKVAVTATKPWSTAWMSASRRSRGSMQRQDRARPAGKHTYSFFRDSFPPFSASHPGCAPGMQPESAEKEPAPYE